MASMTDENILVTKLWSDWIKNEFRIRFWIRFVICMMNDNIVLFNRHDRLIDKTYSVYPICVPLNLEETIWRRIWSGGEVFGLWTHWWVRFRLVIRSISLHWVSNSNYQMMHCIWWAIFWLSDGPINHITNFLHESLTLTTWTFFRTTLQHFGIRIMTKATSRCVAWNISLGVLMKL